nr:hypothetical protein [Tanacetum cinerariifolium]
MMVMIINKSFRLSMSRNQVTIRKKEDPPQDSDIHQLIEECSIEISEEQKQSMEDTMLELVKICPEKEFLCIHDNVDDLIKSALNTKLLSINYQLLDKKKQEVKNVVEQPAERGNLTPILSTKEPEYSSSMGYEHLSITPETESDEVTKSNAKNLLPIPKDKRKCDVPICENSPICDDHSDIFSDFKIDDDISVYDNDFEDIEYVEASFSNPKIVSVEEENDNFSPEFETFCDRTEETKSGNTTHNSLPEYDSFCFEIEPGQERFINLVKNNISDDSSNDPLLEEADLFLDLDNLIPSGIENVADDSEGGIHFLEELLIDDSILSHESSDSNFKDSQSNP